MRKTATGLVEYAKAQVGRPYWYGCFGQVSSSGLYYAKKKQYPRYYTADDFKNQYGNKVHDCIGLIKGYMWCDGVDDKHPKYESNGCPDINEEEMYKRASIKGSIKTMPKVNGILVFKPNHVGVYIGNGYVIEARGHAYGVVKTKLQDRGWEKWCECPYILYQKKNNAKDKKVMVKTNGSDLNCRKEPKLKGEILGAFKNGAKLTLIKKTNKNWYKVKGKATTGKTITGYASTKWLKLL